MTLTTDRAAYLHQSEAIAELLSTVAKPVVVTMGTGSDWGVWIGPQLQQSLREHR